MSLESVFKEACQRHEQLKFLQAQWEFDRKLVSSALQNISAMFPHFSRHDASHSLQLIVNIERMLGDKVNLLTATDMWLIMEAAYQHDIGMVITEKQIEDLDKPEFELFAKSIAGDIENPLFRFAKDWLEEEATLPKGCDSYLFFDKYRQLLAEWFRRKHAENSAKIIANPFGEIGLNSPRNELLPRRLFRVLEKICYAHGQSFEDVMKLPHSEAGMATEDCHPRYVACLLRMADLLDVDDNRFCPVMMRMNCGGLPAHSHAHLEKHQAIRHFRLDTERIEITVDCPTPESYEIAHDWFSWMEKEYHKQSQHWMEIVPNAALGRLPSMAPPKVLLQKPYLIIDEGKKPTLEPNRDAMFKMLSSSGIYNSKYDGIEEILQNAVDSTLIAVWELYKDEIDKKNPFDEKLLNYYRNHHISVELKQRTNSSNEMILLVKDSGTGISLEQAGFMLNVGISGKSVKSELIREMPEWMKPAGCFGIGLQSIFQLVDQFTIKTKSRKTHESLKITFGSKRRDSVEIQVLSNDQVEYGATIEVPLILDRFPNQIIKHDNMSEDVFLRSLEAYDFTVKDSNLSDTCGLYINYLIGSFSYESLIPFSFNGDVSEINDLMLNKDLVYFSEKNVWIREIRFGQRRTGFHAIKFLFRGRKIDKYKLSLPFVSGVFDFHHRQADGFLQYNRNDIVDGARLETENLITNLISEFIDKKIETFPIDEKAAASIFYIINNNDANNKYFDYLKKLELNLHSFDEKNGNSRGLFNEDLQNLISSVVVNTYISFDSSWTGAIKKFDDEICISGYQFDRDALVNIFELLLRREKKFFMQELATSECDGRNAYKVTDEDCMPMSNARLREVLGENSVYQKVGSRRVFPIWGKYKSLEVIFDAPYVSYVAHNLRENKYMILPYFFNFKNERNVDRSDELIDWIFLHRSDKSVTKEKIRELNETLISEFEDILNWNA